MILRAYKVQLDVNNKQQTLLLQHIGCARWAYNWALSCCGWKNLDLKLTDRTFECKMCDMKLDRDLNASLNLKQIYTGSSSGIYASGDGSSSNVSLVSPSLKEEFNKKSRVYILKR